MAEPIIIKDFHREIAQSPHVGFGDMRNVDVYSEPGVLKINLKSVKKSASVVTDWVTWIVSDPASAANIYAVGNTGQTYKSTNTGTSWATLSDRAGAGQGLIIWKGYMFVATFNRIDVFDLSATDWVTSWQNLTSDDWHPMFIGSDDKLYIGNNRFIATVEENSGQNFDPDTSATYTFTAEALDLPEAYRVKCLSQLGENLLIGTWQGVNLFDARIADVFPWDRVSTSFKRPMKFSDNGVNAMITKGNLTYFVIGASGDIYVTDGSAVKLLVDMSKHLGESGGSWLNQIPGSIMIHRNRLFFGTAIGGGGFSPMGIWSVNLETGTVIFENEVSTGNVTGNIGALLSIKRDQYLMGWQETTTYGIDLIGTTNKYTGYAAYIESKFYRVGTKYRPRNFEHVEVQLDRVLATNEGVRIKYRTSLGGSFTTLATFDFTTYGAVQSISIDKGFAAENLQVRIELTTGASSSTTPRVKEVILT